MAFNDPFSQAQTLSQGQAQAGVTYDAGLRAYMLRVYNYMASALALTGIVAMFAASNPEALSAFYVIRGGHVAGMSGLGYLVMFAPFFLVMALGMGIRSMSVTTAQALYWIYSATIGLSLAPIFWVYTGESIARTFFITAGTFGAMSLYGYTTRRNLMGFASFLIMGLIGIIIASIVNLFLRSSGLMFATSILGTFIFVGLTAWDTQKLKAMYYQFGGSGQSEMLAKVSIMGALSLYMDFINIFMHLLRYFGDRR